MFYISLGITTKDFNQIYNDLKVSVTFSTVTQTIDPIYGQTTSSSYSDATKQWIFFKHSSETALKQWGIADVGEAYAIMPTTDSISYGDRITYNSEIFEYTPDCKNVYRYANGTALYKYYTLKRVG